MIICSHSNIDIIQGVIGYGDAEGITDWRISNTSTGILNILNSTSANVRLSILENGNVGIGTTNPASMLDITGDPNITGIYKKNNRDIINDTSNYMQSSSNTLVPRILTEVGNGSNYVSRLTTALNTRVDNTSNYMQTTNSILTNRASSQWTNVSSGIYYNFPIITSTPSATTTGITGNYTYMVFTYTTETAGAGTGQTQYTINIPTGGLVCDILMVGGGGAGGASIGGAGGGGAVLYGTNISVASAAYIIKVGRGATPGETRGKSTEGFSTTILGGGSANNLGFGNDTSPNGNIGGSGGGGKGTQTGSSTAIGGTAGTSSIGTIFGSSYTIYNGNSGGSGMPQVGGWQVGGGGGGGANSIGGNATTSTGRGGNGGDGVENNITGVSYWWGAGGGGGTHGENSSITGGNGGKGGGGAGTARVAGPNSPIVSGIAGTNGYGIASGINAGAGTGSGGGGAAYTETAGSGGSGIVIIRFLSSAANVGANVGIGTSNPTSKLHIYDESISNTKLIIQNNNGGASTTSSIELINGALGDSNIDYKIGNYGGEFKIISSTSTGDTDYIRITSSGASIYGPTGSPQWSTVSDRRIKENIEKASYDKCYDNINKLELYRFNYIAELKNINKDLKQLGYIAQEVQDIFPKAVTMQEFRNDNLSIPDMLSIDIAQINYSLYGAVKKLIEMDNNKELRIKKIENLLNIMDTSNITDISSSNITDYSSNITDYSSNITDYSSNITDISSSNIIDTSSSNVIDTSSSNIDTSSSNIDTSSSNI